MDSVKRIKLQIKRHEAKLHDSRREEYLQFESAIEVLYQNQISFLVTPLDLEFGQAHSVNALVSKFHFDDSGKLASYEVKSHSEWRALSVIESSSDASRVFVAWSSLSFAVDIALRDLAPFVEELCINYGWHSYIIDPVAAWMIEFHSGGLVGCQNLED